MRGLRNQMGTSPFDFAEVFCGVGNLTREMIRGGFRGSGFDNVHSSLHDALTGDGLRLIIDAVTSLKRKGLLWLGTPCSSFVVLCRCQSQRSAANQWLGDTTRRFVMCGNALMEASALLYFLASSLQLLAVLEQPGSSCMACAPSMAGVLEFFGASRFSTYLGAFGASSLKPLSIYSNSSWFEALHCAKPTGMASEAELVVRSGSQFTGCKEELHQSQVYPVLFGRAVMKICREAWTHEDLQRSMAN